MMLSMEYLALSLVSLCLLSVSVLALLSVKGFTEEMHKGLVFRQSVIALGNAMDEVCALGSGNSRCMEIKSRIYAGYEYTGEHCAVFSSQGHAGKRQLNCELDAGREYRGMVCLENKGGVLVLREQ
ncbi:hypothetical protein GF318_05370 [Candidatus Micrarchaeota archaeon]|nr:hypothetical protein [Candidatus Micrarchaeota archaeon]